MTGRNMHKDPAERREYERKYRAKNRERILQIKSFWRIKNLEKVKENHRKWSSENKEKLKQWSREYYQKNRDKVLEGQRKRRQNNLEKVRAIARLSARKNQKQRLAYCYEMRRKKPQIRIANSLRARLRNALRDQRLPKSGHLKELLGTDFDGLMIHLESKFKPGMSWENYGRAWHIDHLRPLASFDLSKADQQAVACHYTNLQPLWASENCAKGAREYAQI